jgi:hypothetical protein
MKVGEPIDMSFNYYHNGKFYFNTYKTSKTYNQQILDVPKELVDLIQMSLKHSVFMDDYLLHNSVGKVSSPELSKMISKAFGFKIGSSAIRNIYLSDKFGDKKSDLEKDSKDMGTSMATALHTYIQS